MNIENIKILSDIINIMKSQKTILIYSGILVAVGLFYWFQIRPSNILKYCHDKMTSPETFSLILTSEFERNQLNGDMVRINEIEREKETFYFNQCLHEKGLR